MIEDELGGWSAGDNYVMFAMEIFGENKGEKGGVKRNMQLCSCISVRLYFDKEKEMQENAIEVEWGSVTLVDAERRLLANALLDFSNERFVLLSDSCIPLYNFSTVYKYLIGSIHSFVGSYDDPSRYGRGRYSSVSVR
ncbi:glycosyltransferase BC10-like isoform X2 [Nicotiana tabacum]|uniref:Glycosyltransferase BC10-like isoform X2 n=1 Tax=Nicotiana tabacum TaxID=4097 RepID=A0A1S4CDI8_TOBAC|nr:glycosyltransferase BC10-like isoform X3 [Nicotiana tomentosiformis]XP_016499215.1 PREDICTED: uncharacterized protein LOC107817833 isoform X2 [Nicotiana tabacum]